MTTQMSLDDYTDAVHDTMRHWLDVHTNAQSWADAWSLDGDWQVLVETNGGMVENSYFSFDVKQAALEIMDDQSSDDYQTCDNCGLIWDNGCEDCDCEIERDDNGEEVEHTYHDTTKDELLDFWRDCGNPDIPDWCIEKAMVTSGFEAYTDAIGSVIAPVVEEVKDVIDALDSAGDDGELLVALTWANHTMHVNGNILKDYGDHVGLDYDLVCNVSQNGLLSVFPELAEVSIG